MNGTSSPSLIRRYAADASGQWQTEPNELSRGTYLIAFQPGDMPPGTSVPRLSVPNPPSGALVAATFEIGDANGESVDTLVVPDIEANPYPTITGRVLEPKLTGTTLSWDGFHQPTVTGTCNGNPVTIGVAAPTVGGNAAIHNEFTITKQELQQAIPATALPASCQLQVSAPGRTTMPVTITNIDVGRATTTDRRVAVPLAKTPVPLSGRVFWVDRGQTPADEVELDATIATNGPVITEFMPTVTGATGADPAPGFDTATLSTTTSPTGEWAFPTAAGVQIFGNGTYQFEATSFGTGTFDFRVDQTSAAIVPGSEVAVDTAGAAGVYDVEMTNAVPGEATGTITVRTNRTTGPDVDITVTGSGPGGANPSTTVNPGTFSFPAATPGQWTVMFSTPAHHRQETPGASGVTKVVAPGTTPTSGFDAIFTELGSLELTLQGTDAGNTPITTKPTVTLTPRIAGPGTVPQGPLLLEPKPGETNVFELPDISVAGSGPATQTAFYDMAVTVAGFDTSGATAVPINVRAGEVTASTLALPKFGGVSGEIFGSVDANGSSPEQRPINGTTTSVTVTPITSNGGAPNGSTFIPTTSGSTYEFSAAPGWYRIDVSSVGFHSSTRDVQVVNNVLPAANPQPFTLQIVRGSIDLTAVRDLTGALRVPGASYELFVGSCPSTGTAVTAGGVDGTPAAATEGQATIGNLLPGNYCLEVREVDGLGEALAFPAIAAVNVGRSTTPLGDPPVGAATTIVAPLPQIISSVTGMVKAVNGNGDPVPIPPSSTLTIAYGNTYLEVDSAPTGTAPNVPEACPAADCQTTVTRPTPTSTSAQYTFTNVPVGKHTIAATTTATEYAAPADQPVEVGVGGSTFGPSPGGDIVFTVTDVSVTVALKTGAGAKVAGDFIFDPTPRLVSPGSTPTIYNGVYDAALQTIVFSGVQPEVGQFTLDIADPLHTYTNPSKKFSVGTTPAQQTVTVVPTAVKGRVAGTVRQFTSPTTSGDLGENSTITLTSATTPANTQTLTVGAGESVGSYVFDAPAGNYTLTVTRSGFTEPSLPVTIVNGFAELGSESGNEALNLRVDALTRLSATINGTMPSGTTVVLVENNAGSTELPLVADSGTQVFRRSVAAGTYKYLEARAPGHVPVRFPTSASPVLNLLIGTPLDRSFTLQPRKIVVSPVQGASSTAVTDATVSVTVGGSTPSADTTSPYEFFSNASGTAISVSGAGSVVATAPGRRTTAAPIPVLPALTTGTPTQEATTQGIT
ncbi:MAG: hypothetical protein WBP59_14465, partial [Ilumatobacteraceae bacterium]